jgi:hypothetical protein
MQEMMRDEKFLPKREDFVRRLNAWARRCAASAVSALFSLRTLD